MKKTLFFVSAIALSSFGVAAQAATCAEMFSKAEKMAMGKTAASIDGKVKAYQMTAMACARRRRRWRPARKRQR